MLMMMLSAAHAGPFAWVWAHDETRPEEYTPDSNFQENTVGYTHVTVDRISTGDYKVFIPYNTSQPVPVGHVQVSAFGADSKFCKVLSWGVDPAHSPPAVVATVRCFTIAGVAADSEFTLLFNSSSGAEWLDYAEPASRLSYLFADLASSPSYTPALSYQFNSEGGTNTITRLATGRYRVTLPGMTPFGGSVLVTAFGTGSSRCEVSSWTGMFLGTDTTVNVTCHNTAGTLVDSKFTLSYYDRMALANEPTTDVIVGPEGVPPVVLTYDSGRLGAYTWAGGSTAGTSALNAWYSWAAESGGDPFAPPSSAGTITRISAGSYEVTFEDLESFGLPTTALVTAYSGSSYASNHCKIGGWGWWEDAGDTVVQVQCYNTSGVLTDSQFALTFQSAAVELIGDFP